MGLALRLLTIQCNFLSPQLIRHRRFSDNERFMPSTSPLVHGECDVLGLCIKMT